MATTEERLAALEQKMQMLTTPPDDYYMSRWTGEQIDNAVAKINSADGLVTAFNGRSGAVMPQEGDYTAQMVGAAPAGFGLGTLGKVITDLNDATLNGWYYFGSGTLNTPTGISNSEYGSVLVVSRDGNSKTQYYTTSNVGTTVGYDAVRYMIGGIWQPWEYVNPPMQLGVEYRTTERFMSRPVYTKLIDCGQLSDGKIVNHGIENYQYTVRYQGYRSYQALPSIYNKNLDDSWSSYVAVVSATQIQFACGTSAAGGACQVQLWYTKTTD